MADPAGGADVTVATEARCYAELGFNTSMPRGWHGTHVLDLLAGGPDPLTGDADAAGAADLIFVSLPDRAMRDRSGRWLCVHVLDALRFVFDRVPTDRPLVVNLSVGTYAGSHDGKSLLESAIDALLEGTERTAGTAVTVAAGNAYELGVHASAALAPAGGKGSEARKAFVWTLQPTDATDSFLEIWLSKDVSMRVTVDVGDGSDPLVAERCGAWQLAEDDEAFVAAGLLVWAPAVALGVGPMILLALGATTRAGPRGRPLPATDVTVTIENLSGEMLYAEAWIEREDQSAGSGVGSAQPKFSGATEVTRENTLSTLAGGRRTVVVGASQGVFDVPASFTSSGPTRGLRMGPDLVAPGEQSAGPVETHGIRAAALFSGRTTRRRGTSMAAPIVGRALANVLAQAPTLTCAQALGQIGEVSTADPSRTGGRRLSLLVP